MLASGCEVAVIEATSHGLSRVTGRLAHVRFRAGVLTNVTHEHLEFHRTFERYVDDKANLFRAIAGDDAFGVVNADEPMHEVFEHAAHAPVYRCSSRGGKDPAADGLGGGFEAAGIAPSADLAAEDLRGDPTGTTFTLVESGGRRHPARINIPGLFNVDNALAATLTVNRLTGTPMQSIAPMLSTLQAPPGRMQPIRMGQGFTVIVDYAHTPGAFTRLLPAMRAQTPGRLIALFGSAGERDTEKRAIQGRIADRYCDVIVLADEDPRGEEPAEILSEIAAGITGKRRGENLFLIPSRRAAMAAALSIARDRDTVLLLGKAHESSIIYRAGPIPWNEAAAARECLSELGYRR